MILQVEFSEVNTTMDFDLGGSDMSMEVDFGELHKVGSDDIPVYDGSYEVTPSVDAQTLETAGKLMEDDTKIKAIPVYEVSNTAGGTTVYIGTEV